MAFGTMTTNSFRLVKAAGPVVPTVTPMVGGAVGTSVGTTALTNPAFMRAEKANPLITGHGQDAKIVRGYIRRDPDPADSTSQYRLLFMYNPESIQRNYINYLAQGALDPYNTIYQAGNLVVPPGILDFSFELLFDRQIEAGRAGDRGCNVDYDYFQRVVRGVEPSAPASINNIPDNGVLLVDPNTITVVFSEQLQVQGKVSQAVVSYDRFNHLMVPTRMRIGIQMKVVYIGDGRIVDTFDLQTEQATQNVTATVPYDNSVQVNIGSGGPLADLLSRDYTGILAGLGIDTNSSSPTQGENDPGASGGSSTAVGDISGVSYPPNLGGSVGKGALGGALYRMPDPSPAGLYLFSGGNRNGSKQIMGVLYTVAKVWHATYPNSTLRIGDINAPSGHVSHKKGVDVDVTVSDRSAANMSVGNRDKSIQLGKWFIDTGIIKLIFYNDTAVQAAVNAYAKSKGKPGIMESWPGHDTHFHVRILDSYAV